LINYKYFNDQRKASILNGTPVAFMMIECEEKMSVQCTRQSQNWNLQLSR